MLQVFPDSKLKEGVIENLISYEDEKKRKEEIARKGIGEHGAFAAVPVDQQKQRQELWDVFGFNAHLSSLIALDRDLPDIRHSK